MSDVVLRTRELTREFGALVVTDHVSIELQRGARHALIGPNGAGKTTLVNLLTGVLAPSGGRIELQIAPAKEALRPLELVKQGRVQSIRGMALSSHLKERDVSRRMGRECERALKQKGFRAEIEFLHDEKESPAFERPSIQPGAALAVWAESDAGSLIGADMAGARGRTAEFIGKQTAQDFLADLSSGAAVDRHLADQVIPFAALAKGTTTVRIPSVTDHVEARLWLVEKILGVKFEVRKNTVTIEGIGFLRG
mgnify:CR=1 FL=1